MRNATRTERTAAQKRDAKGIYIPKGTAALTASSLYAGGGPAKPNRIIQQRKINKPVRHLTEE